MARLPGRIEPLNVNTTVVPTVPAASGPVGLARPAGPAFRRSVTMDVWRMDGAPHHGTAPFVARQGEGMTRSLRRTALVVVAAALLGWACDDNTTPTLPTDPT